MKSRGVATAVAVAWIIGLAGCSPAPEPAGPVTIVATRGPFGSALEAARSEARVDWWDADSRDDDACTESFAATELARFLPACLGLPPGSVRIADSLPPAGDAIVLGSRASNPAVAAAALGSAPPPDGYTIELVRRDGRRVVVVEGGDRAGTLYGAYALLERLGMRFYGLGDTGTVAPATPARWPHTLSVRESPAFATRGFWAWEPRGNREFFEWMVRNRMNLWTAADTAFVPLMKKLAIRLSGGGHGVQAEFLDPARFFRLHPEWYGLHDGRRSPAIGPEAGDNFCTSNAEARHQLARGIVAALESGSLRHADRFELWMLDQGRWCECEACRAQGSPAERLLDVAGEVTAAVDSARRAGRLARPVSVVTLAYLETARPPRRAVDGKPPAVAFYPYFRCYAHALADSSCTEINARLAAEYRGWRNALPAGAGGWGVCEYYNVGTFKSLPLVFPHVMARDLRWYRQTGATSFSYMHAPTRSWGSWTLNHALLAALLWNPGADPDTLMRRFCADYYPGAAAPAQAFFQELETASANIFALQASTGVYGSPVPGGRLSQQSLPVFRLLHLREMRSAPPRDDGPDLDEIEGSMIRARTRLNQAMGAARDPIVRARLGDLERRFAYGEAAFQLYVGLIRTAVAHRSNDPEGARRTFEGVERTAERLRAIHDLVQVAASHANASDGLEASGVLRTYEFFRALYGRRG